MKKLWLSGFNLRAHTRDARLKVTIVAVLAIFTLVPCFSAMAQEEGQEEDAFMLEEITVTGSRIRGVEGVGTSVIGLDREDINMSPKLGVDGIIKELPSVMDLGVTEVTRAQGGGAMNRSAQNSVNIHGIGPYSTLVLFDGHRMTNTGKGTEPGVFPTLGVQRIEVVADGASAVYGSDAVAGVVNIIPRRTLHGVETMFRIGTAQDMDPEWKAGAAVGKMWDSGQFMVAYEHTYRGELRMSDRDFATDDQRPWGGNDWRTREASPGTIVSGGGRGRPGSPPPPEVTYAIPEGGVTAETNHLLVAGTENLYENFAGKDLLPEQENNNAMFTFNQMLNDIEFFADGFYAKRDFGSTRGGYPRANITVPNTNAWWVPLPDSNARSYNVEINLQDMPGTVRDLLVGDVKHWEITPGFRYDLPRGFQFEGLFTYGESREFSSYEGAPGRGSTVLNDAAASSDPATSLDVYGLGRTSPEVIAEIISEYSYSNVDMDFQGYEASINGPVFDLPGGTVSLAAGYEGQRYTLNTGNIRGNIDGVTSTTVNPEQTRDIDSFYLEVYIPFFGRKNATTGLNRLELTAAIRHDEYSDVGGTTNPRVGFNYSPIEPLLFHGSYGTSFRAPLLENLGASAWSEMIFMIQNYQDPTSPSGSTQGYTLRGNNPNLVPEESKNLSFGVSFTPTEDTMIKLDYFNVEYDKQIVSLMSDTGLLAREASFTGSGLVLRNEEAVARVYELVALGMEEPGRGWIGGSIDATPLYVDGRNVNAASSTTAGIDFQISHNVRTDSAGSFRFTLDGTYLTSYKVGYSSEVPESSFLNQINNPLRFKARGGVTWRYEPFTTQVAFRYINSYDNPGVSPTQKIDSWTPVDLVLRFDGDNVDWLGSFGTGLSISLEARNAFDLDPPYANFAPNMSGGGGWDPSAADPVGRLLAFSVRKSF